MSFAPESSKAVRRYIAEQAGVLPENISIRAARSAKGYHAGESDIFGPNGLGWGDRSVRRSRDKAGLSNASAAIDIKLPVKRLKALTAYLVEGARAGTLDLFEIVGPDADGKATYWAKSNGWKPVYGWTTKAGYVPVSRKHEWHVHLSLPRDTEFADRVAIFRPFFEVAAPAPVDVPVEPPVDPDLDEAPNLTDMEQLAAENEELRAALLAIGAAASEALA